MTSSNTPVTPENSFFSRYIGKGATARIEDARAGLVNNAITLTNYEGDSGKRQGAILEQYRIYVEMADRISARRAITNTFFITLNSMIFGLIGVFWKDGPAGSAWFLFVPALALVGQCLAWFWLLRSYRQLNSGKYATIGALEELLPVSPYWGAEWRALGEGNDKSKYWPLTHLEQWMPVLFGVSYVTALVIVLLLSQ